MIHAVGDKAPIIHATAFVHPAATVIGAVELGAHSSVWPGAVLRGDFAAIHIGERTNIQDNAVIHAAGDGTHIGRGCTIAHLAFVEQAVIEDDCLVGVGSRILNRVSMRKGSVAAAGALVLPGTEIPTGMRAQGVPATIVDRQEPSLAYIEDAAEQYVEMAKRISRSLP
jgi:carbonic anhydrase/acetyltransferase-like protein (isoleucine patch superfamily)